MKKIYTFIFAALVLAASCTPSVEPDGDGNPPIGSQVPIIMKSYTITATKDADTKVSVADDGSQVTSVTWEEGDAIRVYNSHSDWDTEGIKATLTSGAGESSATFTFEAPEDREPGFFVVYGATATFAEGKVNINVPATVTETAKPILAGYTSSDSSIGSVDLQAVCAYMKVTLKETVDAVRFFAVNNGEGERLAGTVAYDTEGTISTTPASEKPILTVTAPSTTFYVNILPGTLTQGYIIDVVKGSEHMIKSAGYGKSRTFETRFSKLDLSSYDFAPVRNITATVSAKTTYSQYLANNKGTTDEGANNPANTYKVWGGTANLTAVDNISDKIKGHLQPTKFYCDGAEMINGEANNLSLGSHIIKADYGFVCGGVTINLAEKIGSGTAHITGLPYNADKAAIIRDWDGKDETYNNRYTWTNNSTSNTVTRTGSLKGKLNIPSKIESYFSIRMVSYTLRDDYTLWCGNTETCEKLVSDKIQTTLTLSNNNDYKWYNNIEVDLNTNIFYIKGLLSRANKVLITYPGRTCLDEIKIEYR